MVLQPYEFKENPDLEDLTPSKNLLELELGSVVKLPISIYHLLYFLRLWKEAE